MMYGFIPIHGLSRLLMEQGLWDSAVGRTAYFLLSVFFSWGPMIIAVLSFILLLKGKGVTRAQLLNCALLVKYALIPLYLAYSAKISLLIWTLFVPSLIAIISSFVILSGVFSILFTLLGTTAFSIPYLVRAKSDGAHNKYLIKAVTIMQFIFVLDVISIALLAFKERRWRKLTVAVLVIVSVIAALFFISVTVFLVMFFAPLAKPLIKLLLSLFQ